MSGGDLRASIPSVAMGDGVPIPQFGVGTYKVSDGDAERIVTEALEVGYRHIDTAAMYGNEEGVGRAIRASGIPRDELFVTTKVWNDDHGRERATEAMRRSLDRLGLPAVDLILIHWPDAARGLYVETGRRSPRRARRGSPAPSASPTSSCRTSRRWMRPGCPRPRSTR